MPKRMIFVGIHMRFWAMRTCWDRMSSFFFRVSKSNHGRTRLRWFFFVGCSSVVRWFFFSFSLIFHWFGGLRRLDQSASLVPTRINSKKRMVFQWFFQWFFKTEQNFWWG